MKMRLLAVAVVVLGAVSVFAADVGTSAAAANLEPGFATTLADTTTTPVGKFSFGVNGSYLTDGGSLETALLEVAYGITADIQATAAWPLVVGEGKVAGNGDTYLALLWAPVKEQDWMPSMGVEIAGKLPTGYGFTGYDGTITGVASKVLGPVRAHVNASLTTLGKDGHVDAYALGMDYMILDNVCLIVDGFSVQNPVPFADRVEMVEVGVRAAITDLDMVSVGVAVGIGNGDMTPDFTATVGYQREM